MLHFSTSAVPATLLCYLPATCSAFDEMLELIFPWCACVFLCGRFGCISEVLDGLQGILTDAGTSMAAGSNLKTDAQKRTWWKQRVDQDQRMAQLVQQLDEDWLGPWRCLLMQPQRSAAEAAAAAAAEDVLSEHFCALGESSRQCTAMRRC
jgi:hypothetical protein